MPNPGTNTLDLTGRRFLKLAVKNRTPLTADQGAQSSEDSNNEAPQQSLHPEAARTTASHARQASSQILRSDHRHQRRSSKVTVVKEVPSRQAVKKKSAGVFGFLTLKEPSTSALEEFAEQERRKAAQKNSKTSTLPGVSSQKLPDHVPKVNSKWDGLPDSTKRKLDKEAEREKVKRSSTTSLASSGTGDTVRRSYGSLSSKPIVKQSQDKNRAVSRETTLPAGERPDTATSKDSSPPSSITHSALRHTQGQLSNDVQTHTTLHPPTPSATFRLDPLDNAFEFDLSDMPNLQERDYSSGSATSPEASPRTPAFDSVRPMLDHGARSQSPTLITSTSPEGNNSYLTTECEDKVSGGNAMDSLVRLSAKETERSLSTNIGITMPPMNEAAGTTNGGVIIVSRTASPEPAMVRNFSDVSRYHQRSGTAPSRLSIVPTALAAGPRQNLQASPAAKVKASEKNEVLPWEMFEPPSEAATSSKAAPESGRLKRSSKLGQK